jgi:TIR domain
MKKNKKNIYFPFLALLISVVGLIWSVRKFQFPLSISSTVLGIVGSLIGGILAYVLVKITSPLIGPKSTVFIIHSSNDKDVARRISVSLEKYKIRVIDEDEVISMGDDVIDKTRKVISTSDYVLFVVSNESTKDYLFIQLMSQSKSFSKRIIPILIDKVENVPKDISTYKAVDTTQDFNKATEELAHRLVMG